MRARLGRHHEAMRKRTVYLEQSQIDRLDALAEVASCSRSQLIRKGVEQVLRDGPALPQHGSRKKRRVATANLWIRRPAPEVARRVLGAAAPCTVYAAFDYFGLVAAGSMSPTRPSSAAP
jgi:hypothetical protein